MMEKEVLLAVKNLNVHYRDFQALANISMQIKKGAVVSVIGANGAGKSTLLNTILGINKPASGEIIFAGSRIDGMQTSKIVAKGLSLSPEGSRVFGTMSVEENLLMGAYLPNARKAKAANLEKVYGLFPVLREKARQGASYLSGGQRQMLAIARAIMTDPKLLFCDEISLGLAPIIINDIYATIKAINAAGITIVIVEQDVKRSLTYSDYSYIMLKGRVVLQGQSSELREDDVKDAYFGLNKFANSTGKTM
jgi:branched-chain amino acid transport system ATP-binding protein